MKINLTRRELIAQFSRMAVISSLPSVSFYPFGCGGGNSFSSSPPQGHGYTGTDDQLLEEIERAAFLFFWEQADPTTGQVKDRAVAAGNDTHTVSSIAASGFGLTALCIGDQRGFNRAQLSRRAVSGRDRRATAGNVGPAAARVARAGI